MDKGKCRCSAGFNFGAYNAFYLHNRLAKQFTVLFADYTSLFSTVQYITTSTVSLNHVLSKMDSTIEN